MQIHIIIHEVFEAPGAIIDWANSREHEVSYSRMYAGDVLPNDANGFDFLVVMGGPQSPATTKDECPHFDAAAEMKLIKQAIDADKYVFGACLGAQLIGQALGADFDHSPHREIGVFPIMLTQAGKQDALTSQFPESFLVGHWHGDMPGLTAESEVLAYSEGCPRQIVRYTPKVYGFQCHFEFTLEAIEGMIEYCGHELEEYKNLPYIQNAETLRKQDYDAFNKLFFGFLDGLVEDNK